MQGSDSGTHSVIALPADLVFASRLRTTAQQAGVSALVVRTEAEFEEALQSEPRALALIDLDARKVDAPALIRRLRAAGAQNRIIAFGSHVATESLKAAREAGADRVMARSAFVRELPLLLVMPDR